MSAFGRVAGVSRKAAMPRVAACPQMYRRLPPGPHRSHTEFIAATRLCGEEILRRSHA